MARSKQKSSAFAWLLLMVIAGYASAQTDQQPLEDDCTRDRECARHYLQARTLSKAGQLADALNEYHAAYAIQHVPTLLFNIARLNHKLGRLKEAASAYAAYLRQDTGSDPALKEKAKEYLAQIPPQSEPLSPPPSPPPNPTTPLEPQLVSPLQPPPSESSSTSTPLYKRWWLWTAVGTAALVITVGSIVGTQVDRRPIPATVVDLRSQF